MSELETFLAVDGEKLKVTLYTPVEPKKNQAILFLHGWTGKPNNRAAQLLAKNGYTAVTVVLRGHPGSGGSLETVTRRNSLDDALAAYDFLREQIGAAVPICVTGSSYGAYIAAALSAERELNGVSLRVPANYPDTGFEDKQSGQGSENPVIAAWRKEKLAPVATRSLRALHSFNGRVQIFEAELDEQVPPETVQNYFHAVKDASKLEYHLMKGWPHSLADHAERNNEHEELLLAWIQSL